MPESPPPERLVGGLWCHDVLEHLPIYVDGSLGDALRTSVDQHLAGCTWCAHFGGEYAETVGALQGRLAEPEPLEDQVADRLAARLAEELG